MRFRNLLLGALTLALATQAAVAQKTDPKADAKAKADAKVDAQRDRTLRASSIFYSTNEDDRAVIGINTSSDGMRDTLGLLITSITAGGPADKAGLEEGNRIASLNGVSLRLSSADAGEPDMQGIMSRRLIREMAKAKAGDEVELRIWASGQFKTVKLKTIDAYELNDLSRARSRVSLRDQQERPVLGISVQSTGNRRDTLGLLVTQVVTDGPAEKAGIVEGDRIQTINGVDLRVPREDAGDSYVGSSKSSRFTREMRKTKVGTDIDLRVYSGGQTKAIKVKPLRAEDVYVNENGNRFFFGEGGYSFAVPPTPPMPPMPPMPAMAPRPGAIIRMIPSPGIRMMPRVQFDGEIDGIEDVLRDAGDALRDALRTTELRARARAGYRSASADIDLSDLADIGAVVATTVSETVPYALAAARTAISETVPMALAAASEALGTTAAVFGDHYRYNNMRYRRGGVSNQDVFSLQGLRVAKVNPELVSYLGDASRDGILVLDADDSWAPIRSGDVILRMDGLKVRDANGSSIIVPDVEGGSPVELLRAGKKMTVTLH